MNDSQGSCVIDPKFVAAMDPAMVARSTPVEVIYRHLTTLQAGIIKALTVDVEEFYRRCDPQTENLCLYGTKEGGWKLDVPTDEVPSDLPEPAVGINFARDGMDRKDWLTFVALHSDAWILSLTAFYGSELRRDERKRLMFMLGDLTTAYDVITGKNQESMMLEKGDGSDGFAQGNPIGQRAICNYSQGTVSSQYGIPEQAIAEVSTARTVDRGSSHLPSNFKSHPTPTPFNRLEEKPAEGISGRTVDGGSDALPSDSAEMEVVKERDYLQSDSPARPPQSVHTTVPLSESFLRSALPERMGAPPSLQSNGSEGTSADALLLKVSNPVKSPPAPLRTKRQTKRAGTPSGFVNTLLIISDDDDHDDDEHDYEDEGPCDICRGKLRPEDRTNWVQCDDCQKWVHCECVKISPAKAKNLKRFKCQLCRRVPNELHGSFTKHCERSYCKWIFPDSHADQLVDSRPVMKTVSKVLRVELYRLHFGGVW